MKKLTLDLHALRVESFDAAGADGARTGTVRGNAATPDDLEPISYPNVCSGEESCDVTVCATCYCPYSGPMASCVPCSNYGCDTLDPAFC